MEIVKLGDIGQAELTPEQREEMDARLRQQILTEENLQLIGQLLATQRPLPLIARKLGISYARMRRWLLEGARLRWRGITPEQDLRVALHIVVCLGEVAGEEWLIDRIREEGSMRALEFLAERRYPRNWAPRKKIESGERSSGSPSQAIPHEIKVQVLNQWCGGEGPRPGLRGGRDLTAAGFPQLSLEGPPLELTSGE
jgi:hypothetical protein